MEERATLAVIGGSGFYTMDGLERIDVETPFGATSDAIYVGQLAGTKIAFLSRHGVGHRLSPSEVPYRANVWALASLGVRMLVAVSAVGSLKHEIEPLHFVLPDQLIDRTNGRREPSFFGDGLVGHIAFEEPYCQMLSGALQRAAVRAGGSVHASGTLIVIEGPAFSTRAESLLYRSWGASIIGMTALPEAKLAREAGICYACLASVTDYDTWHPDHASVSVDLVLRNLIQNVDTARKVVANLAGDLPGWQSCRCCFGVAQAVVTDLAQAPEATKRRLGPILERHGLLPES
jgi:5'-methylthioadenosine phosphorylase